MVDNIRLPLIPLRGLTIFPNMVLHFDVGRQKSIAAIKEALSKDSMIFLACQNDVEDDNPDEKDIREIGTISVIKQIIKLPGDTMRVLVEGKYRGRIKDYINNDELFEVNVEKIQEIYDENDLEIKAYFKSLKDNFIKFIKEAGESTPEMIKSIKREKDIAEFTDMVSSFLPSEDEDRINIFEEIDLKKRILLIIKALQNEIKVLEVQKKITSEMKKNVDDSQKEYYLREQLKLIQEELGEDDEDSKTIKKYQEKIASFKAPAEVKSKVNYEFNRLKGMSVSSSEGSTIQSYLDWVLDIPWGKNTKESLDIRKAREILNEDHYGLEDVKDRIIEYLAAKKFSGSLKGPIICLVGPPGVGKTSIAKSIARAINRKYTRMSLGGIRDEAEIRGHRRTYVASIPGRIAYSLKDAKSMNPLILLDEIDKLSGDAKGNPADALLEVLDSEQNNKFRDNYLELPMDLSKVLFITTANSLDTIPRPLLDRMEVIEVSGYTYEEKLNIAKKYLLTKIFNEYKINEDIIKISDESIKLIINGYTRESGVRSLERTLNSLVRKALTEMLNTNKEKINITVTKVEQLLGKVKFTFDEIETEDKVGVVTGLAWTAYGGDTLAIEVMVMNGSGKLNLTGKLGEVMQESAKTAYSYVRSNAAKYGIDTEFYKTKDIHIHVPEGAVPKDGPSAGVTMVTALVSGLSGKKVKGTVAMTGEVTLTGRVLPIGGLKEKSLAAYRAGIKTILIPKDNEKDIEDIPTSIRNKIKIISAKDVTTVINNAIIGEENNEN